MMTHFGPGSPDIDFPLECLQAFVCQVFFKKKETKSILESARKHPNTQDANIHSEEQERSSHINSGQLRLGSLF